MTTIPSVKRRPRLEIKVARTLKKFGMVQPGEHVLVAVSGGPDSVALIRALRHLAPAFELRLSAAHLNHRLRGEESEADEAFVRGLCRVLGVSLCCESVPVASRAAASGGNLEEAARELRYDFLSRAAAGAGSQKIALGHSLDDQAETVLMRLFRGSGSRGLSGIQPVLGNRFIRPLLECSRGEIAAYLQQQEASYREDSSNRDLRYLRNRIRLELIPYLERHVNPGVSATLARHAALNREISDYLEHQAAKVLEDLRIPISGGLSLGIECLLDLDLLLQKMILRQALKETRGSLRGITQCHIEAILGLCRRGRSGRRIELPGRHIAARQFNTLVFLRKDALVPAGFSYELKVPGRIQVPEAGLEISARIETRTDPPASLRSTAQCACLDADRLPGVLTVRSRLPGDRYGGRKKVKKMLVEARIPWHRRAALPLVVAGQTVVWAPGLQPPRSLVPGPESERCLVIELTRVENSQAKEPTDR